MNDKPNILVLCTGNSCRSQIAEGYLRHYAGDRFNIDSAGTEPAERVHPFAVQVMQEDGVDISSQSPKSVNTYEASTCCYLIVVCGGANEACPRTWPGMHERLYWPFDDPARFKGTPTQTLAEFRRVRNQIKARILSWLDFERKEQS